jgi:predicted dehydrogenase
MAATSVEELISSSSAVYIASPHTTHCDYAAAALTAGKHVLCEKPMALTAEQVRDLQELAQEKRLVLLEALKTAFLPGFERLVGYAKSGSIGDIRAVDATFTKLVPAGTREYDPQLGGGSVSELASYPLLPVLKLLGPDYESIDTTVLMSSSGVDEFARITLRYPPAIATVTTGIGVKSEGDLVISGSKGYVYVPAPWWLTKGFEGRFENVLENQQFQARFDGDGLRYEIAEFQRLVASEAESHRLRPADSLWLAQVIESARERHMEIR